MISGIFIDRPRLAFVVSIVITLAGLIAIFQIPVAQFPEIVPPQVTLAVFGRLPAAPSFVRTCASFVPSPCLYTLCPRVATRTAHTNRG
jgi:hypothetical protein